MAETITEISERWESRYRYGSVEDRKERMRLWQPYYSMIYAAGEKAAPASPEPDELIRKLAEEQVLNKEACVLDIGCGTGNYALQMAPYVKKITAMDMNETAPALRRRLLFHVPRGMQSRRAAADGSAFLRILRPDHGHGRLLR